MGLVRFSIFGIFLVAIVQQYCFPCSCYQTEEYHRYLVCAMAAYCMVFLWHSSKLVIFFEKVGCFSAVFISTKLEKTASSHFISWKIWIDFFFFTSLFWKMPSFICKTDVQIAVALAPLPTLAYRGRFWGGGHLLSVSLNVVGLRPKWCIGPDYFSTASHGWQGCFMMKILTKPTVRSLRSNPRFWYLEVLCKWAPCKDRMISSGGTFTHKLHMHWSRENDTNTHWL